MQTDEMRAAIVSSATTSASNALGFQVSKAVDIAINGLMNALLGESTIDKREEMNAHHDKLLEIVQRTPVTPPRASPMMSPREKIESDVRDSNVHIRNAIGELQKARSLSKCAACKGTLDNTINYVGEATSEILDVSEKILAMQKLKDVGELHPESKWDDLTSNQKKMVNAVVQQYHPLKENVYGEDGGEETNGTKVKSRKLAPKRQSTGRKVAKK